MELSARDCPVVYAVVILKQREHLDTTLAHAVSKTVHDFLKHLISILCESVQIWSLLRTILNGLHQRVFLKI